MDVNRLMSGAVEAHRQGRLEDAMAAYDRILAGAPDQPDALHYRGMLRHQTGDSAGAAEDMARALALRPRDANFRFNLAEVLREAGRPDESLPHYKKIVELAPGDGDARFGLANAQFDLGDYAGAVRSYQAAARAIPDDPEIRNNLGNALLQLGETESAAEAYRAAATLDPGYAEAVANLASALASHETDAAEAWQRADGLFRARISGNPQDVEALIGLARARVGLEDDREAMGALLEAERLAPNDGGIQAMLGRLYMRVPRFEDAARCFAAALAATPDDPVLNAEYADALAETGAIEEAHRIYTALHARDPESPVALNGLGNTALRGGRFDEAADHYRRALAADPHYGQAWLGLAACRALTSEDTARLEAALNEEGFSPNARQDMHFALADAADRTGDYDLAIGNYASGNAIRQRRSNFDPEAQTVETNRALAVFTKDFFNRHAGSGAKSDLPVLIVGMPRSGTTLAEQIAASHPEVHGAGELYALTSLAQTIRSDAGSGANYPEILDDLRPGEAAEYGSAYLETLKTHDPDAARVADKMPGNFMHLGLAALLIPGARIIHCTRGAIDTCLSCYFQNFRSLDFSFDLASIGHFYRNYRRYMDHWKDVLPLPIHEFRYEEVIGDPETQSRKLIDHLDLPWDDACLSHHKTDRPISTASIWQARQPVYKTSVERWRRYEKHIGPLIDALGEYADE